jgi:hypothetical protein
VTFYLLVPLILTIGVALGIQSQFAARRTTSFGRVGAISLGAQALAATFVIAAAVIWLERPVEDRCGRDDGYGYLLLFGIFATAIFGGVVLAAVIADYRKQGGLVVWHLPAAPLGVVLPYVAGFAVFIVSFSCLS